ncbi:MAG: molybdopterin-dependent oxidoreductase [Verrucomicrobiota bacterium]
MAHKLTTCTFCGVGCGIYLETTGNRVTGVYPSMTHPSNRGRICVRGWNVHEVASSPDRLTHPMVRKNGKLEPVEWPEAIQFIVTRLNEIRKKHGPDALAFCNSPRCSNEESYLLQKLARSVIGTNNVEHGTGVYSNNSVDILLDMLGCPASTNSIGELAKSEVIIVDGVDLAQQMPTIGGWVIRAKLAGAKLIVIDARRHRLAELADHLLLIRPGNRVTLYGAMAKIILDRGLMDHQFIRHHCREFEAFASEAHQYDLLNAAEICGVPAELIEAAAVTYAKAKSAAILYSTGVEARGKNSVRSMINLALMTGNIGRPASGIFALTEHNNLQGVCDMGMLHDRLPGYQPVEDASARQRFEQLWKTPLPTTPGVEARRIMENAVDGKIKGLWLLRYDPVTTATFCDAAHALEKMELVVVQHLFETSTMRYAHVVLPVVAFGEEQITFTSTDRRIQMANKIIEPPSGPVPAWKQITEIAHALGADWGYQSAAEIMEEIGRAVPFYSGASHENLARDYGRQWPCTTDKPLGTTYLHEDGIPGKPFKFVPVPKPEDLGKAPPDYPMALIFGHALYYWHQNVLIKHSETLKRELRVLLLDYPDGFVEINDEDAKQLGIRDGAKIRVVGHRGAYATAARVTREVRTGTIVVPFFVKEIEKEVRGDAPTFNLGNLSRPFYVRLEKA